MSSDIVKDTAEGAVIGLLNWSKEEIKSLVNKLKDKELAFIQDEKTIKIIKEQYRSGELAIYREYIENVDLIFLLKLGLTLRKLEQEKDLERRRQLREKIFNKYKVNGLHIAQLVENGILNRYIGILIDDITSIDQFKKDIMAVLQNIEKHVLFVQGDDKERDVIKTVITSISSNLPFIFVISGISSAANIVRSCENRLVEILKDYNLEKISAAQKENLFFKRILRN